MYEQAKEQWLRAHPECRSDEYQAACRRIAADLGL